MLRARARTLARRLLPRLGAGGAPRRRGTHRLAVHVGSLEGDVDLERSLERSSARRPRHPEQLVTRRFAAAPRTVCLLVDRSGSMGGHAVALAAVAASAVLAAAGGRLRCGVIAFASETMVLRDPGDATAPERVVDDLLSLRGHGRTDLAAALAAAAVLLRDVGPGGRTAILLSDCLHTKGVDPRGAAARLDCLHVLATSPDDDAREAGRVLAARGRGRFLAATTIAELAVSLPLALR